MDLTADLANLRAEAESLMTDTCTITVPSSGAGSLDPTGWPTNPAGTVIYSPSSPEKGKCRLRMGGTVSGSSSRAVAADRVFMSQPVLSLPISAPVIPVGALVVTGSGIRAKVVGQILGSQMTAQRVTVEVVTG